MKLNLLPTYVTKGKATKTAVVVSSLVFLVSVAAAVGMAWAANDLLENNKQAEASMRPRAQATVDTFAYAVSVPQDPRVTQVLRNAALARAMIAHNSAYPNFYNKFLRYVPSFFRVITIQATPNGPENATVTMTGAIRTYQQYADLMLALLRNPDAVSVARSGFISDDLVVPAISQADQIGAPTRSGETPLPRDPLERLEFLMNQNYSSPGFTGTGNFGTEGTQTRGAAPGYSVITVTMVVKGNLQVPDIAGTLRGGGTGAPAAGGAGGFGMPPGMGGAPGMPPGMGGPPGMPPGMGAPASAPNRGPGAPMGAPMGAPSR